MTVNEWLEGSQLGVDIWTKKYQRNDETFDEWLDRVSGGNQEVRNLIEQKKFLFGGRILSNRGIKGEKVTYSNCYVISPPEDNLESIYDCAKKLARTYSYGGGCGIDISKLSPAGAKVNNQARTTSGAVSFMDTFSQVTQQIGQNGRRGALMISLDCTHPDLEKFISVKNDLTKVTAANISVRVSDDFMRAVENDEDWKLSFYRAETDETIEKTVRAKEIFYQLCDNNYDYAEPGLLFWDLIRDYNMLSEYDDFSYAGVNPCAEEPLPAGGSCLLGSINLSAFVSENGVFNYTDFSNTVKIAVEALNEVLDEGQPLHPLEEQRNSVHDWRQIGLGIMGLADMLIKMHIPYGSAESLEVCNKIGEVFAKQAIEESLGLAMSDGAFPKCSGEKIVKSPFIFRNITSELIAKEIQEYGLRNSQLLTIAPTGTLSTMLGISGGIEPIFANSYTRKTQSLHGEDVIYKVYTPIVEKYMKEHGIDDEKNLPDFFVTAKDISPKDRIAMQATWQDHIDASISSTINLPNSATSKDIYDIYMTAWKEGLKGVTVYRSGCKREGILVTEQPKKKSTKTIGLERHLTTGCGSLHVCAFFDEEGNLKNTYLSKGSTGGCNNFMIGLSRMISLAAREGVDILTIVDQLNSSGTCPSYAVRRATKCDTSDGSSCPVAVGNALIDMWKEIKGTQKRDNHINGNVCPECGAELVEEMGCVTCKHCGYSRCG